jgi:hypothetical protein
VGGAGDRAEPGGQDWMPEIEEIRRRRDAARAMGGPQKVARQRASGRLTVRERIDRLAAPGTFAEIGALTGFAELIVRRVYGRGRRGHRQPAPGRAQLRPRADECESGAPRRASLSHSCPREGGGQAGGEMWRADLP